MPELPEVEIVRRGLRAVLQDRRIKDVITRRPDLRFPLPHEFSRTVSGRRIEAVGRRGKYLLIGLSGDLTWLAHLGMSGRFHVHDGAPPPPGRHDHVEFRTDDGCTVRFRDPRRFGFMDLWPAGDLGSHPMLARLGPEPLEDSFTARHLAARLAGKLSPIKTALLDQGVVAGLGNIYACEALFRAGMSPRRTATTVVGQRAVRLVEAVKTVLVEAIEAGGSSLRDYRRPSGEVGTFQNGFAVYGRAGARCPGCSCDVDRTGGIVRIVQAGRSTFFCAKRQR